MEGSTEQKRFTLSQEEFAQERIAGIKSAVEELKIEHPEIVSLMLFGSLSKGQSREQSDIDGILFVDAEKVEEMEKIACEHLPVIDYQTNEEDRTDGPIPLKIKYARPYFRPDLYKKYNDIIVNKINEKIPGLKPEQTDHLRSLPISKELLSFIIEQYKASEEAKSAFLAKIQEQISQSQDKSKEKILATAKFIEPKPDSMFKANNYLGGMFHLDVGGGIREYRKFLIDELISMGAVGELIWEDVVKYVEKWEQKVDYKDLPTEVHYPRVLQEAKVVYA